MRANANFRYCNLHGMYQVHDSGILVVIQADVSANHFIVAVFSWTIAFGLLKSMYRSTCVLVVPKRGIEKNQSPLSHLAPQKGDSIAQ